MPPAVPLKAQHPHEDRAAGRRGAGVGRVSLGLGAFAGGPVTETNTQRYPLAWPMNWKRTPPTERRRAEFRGSRKTSRTVSVGGVNRVEVSRENIALTIATALDRLDAELRRLGAVEEILSSNVPVGIRGLPLSVSREPTDPGVAIYITLDRKPLVFACDKWDR